MARRDGSLSAPAPDRDDGGKGPAPWGPAVVLASSALALFLGGSLWLALYPPVPLDLGRAANLDARAGKVRIPVGADHLDGWLLEGPRRTVVIFFHGYGRDHHRAWRYAGFLHRAGYDVLAVDFRSSRAHDRVPTTLGAHELADAEATLAWARSARQLSGHRVVLFGESLGGSVALVTAARTPGIAAVIADCPFASGRRALEDTFAYWLRLPGAPFAAVAEAAGRTLTGSDPGTLDAVAAADSLEATPLFLIHARDDDRMRAAQAEDLWRAAGGKDELWLTGGGHNEGWMRDRREYERRVLAFLDRALGPAAR